MTDYLEQATIDGVDYDLHDAGVRSEVTDLKSQNEAMGFSVVNGKLCVTYLEED